MSTKKRSALLEFALIFAVVYLGSQFALRYFFPAQFGGGDVVQGIVLRPQDSTVKGGHHPVLILENNTDAELTLDNRCPMPPVEVFAVERHGMPDESLQPLETTETALPCEPLASVAPKDEATIDLAPWKYSLFGSMGVYEVRLPAVATAESALQAEGNEMVARFSISEPGVITQVFRTFVTKPFLNFLIFLASILPGHSLGWAIIILTILVKLLLFFPTQHAMEGQKKLQAVQPRLDALKEQFKNDPQQLQRETMRIWKEEKINPLQSCLPMLIQFPILIGVFFVIRDGSVLALSQHLLYGVHENLPWTFGTDFFGLDLLKPSRYIFPPLLVILQFGQMKLSFAMNKKKQPEKVIEVAPDGSVKKQPPSAQEMQQKMMLYGLPLMIGIFAFQFPAAVSLYWGISTLFAIGQQVVVNRRV